MTVRRLAPQGDAGATARALRALAEVDSAVTAAVTDIIAAVRSRGDEALTEYVERFDAVGGAPLRVTAAELDAALEALDPGVRAGLDVAIANVAAVARAGLAGDTEVQLAEGHTVTLRDVPVRRAAMYVPGGRNPYPSTVVMGAVTAKVAGVDEVVVCAPGSHPVILAACRLCGVDEVWRMGGAHAVAALALGTGTVERVDVIAGPGSPYVQEAKRQLSGEVGIDGFFGPSDVLVLAGGDADAELVTADLLAQAEHGPGTIAALVTDDPALADQVTALVEPEQRGEAEIAVVVVPDMAQGLAVAEAFAPEHLELVGREPEALVDRIRSAGCVFVGRAGGTAFGDYVAGSNHSLPTGGAARFASGLSTRHFRRRMSVVRIGDAAGALARAGSAIAEAEGFPRHAASMRKRDNGGS